MIATGWVVTRSVVLFLIHYKTSYMTQITLSDYLGFIFSEIVRARSITDAESKRIALIYKDDEILKNFSVPRFKIPEMELAIPVLVSGARYKSTLGFNQPQQDFTNFINAKLDNVVQTIRIRQTGLATNYEAVKNPVFVPPMPPLETELASFSAKPKKRIVKASARSGIAAGTPIVTLASLITIFFNELKSNPDPSLPENIVQVNWARLFDRKLTDASLTTAYRTFYPNGELFVQTNGEVLTYVKNNTVVLRSEIENLLVNPETQTVKDGSNADSVFMVKAKIVEDGVFIKEVVDDRGVVQERFVEFD
jgi:hypothetical protein